MAILAVAVVPLLGTLFLGQAVLREAYQVGVNQQVRSELEKGLEMFREYFVALRQSAEQSADAIAADWGLRRALEQADSKALEGRLDELLDTYQSVARIAVADSSGRVIADLERGERLEASEMKSLELSRAVQSGTRGFSIKVTVITPSAPFEHYQRAGELVEVYSRLEAGTYYVSNVYLAVFIGFLLSVIAAALAVGIVMSRRVTRRVNMLVEATTRVGAGDLTVEVPADSKDEIGDLTRSFNEMVRDIRESRGRIEYLQRISAWQEFARRLAHEIKNPLTPIQLAMQEVHKSYHGDDQRYRHRLNEALSIVEEEVATLRRLVGEFSQFARLPEVRLDPADLNDIVRDFTRTAAVPDETGAEDDGESAAAPVTVSCEPWPEPLSVRVDAMMLKRCIDNLVRNSQEAIAGRQEGKKSGLTESTPSFDAGGPAAEESLSDLIQIKAYQEQNWAVLEINDNGPGIPQQEHTRVFDPYFTTKAEGTGLGLAIVKKVVLEHGGEIQCDQSDLGGASFRIKLPLNRQKASSG